MTHGQRHKGRVCLYHTEKEGKNYRRKRCGGMKWHAPLVILAQWALEGGRGYEAGKIDRARPERDIRFCTLIH